MEKKYTKWQNNSENIPDNNGVSHEYDHLFKKNSDALSRGKSNFEQNVKGESLGTSHKMVGNSHSYSVRGQTIRFEKNSVLDKAKAENAAANNMALRKNLQNQNTYARRTGKRGSAYTDSLINDTVKDLQKGADENAKKSPFSQASKVKIRHPKGKTPQIKDVKGSLKSAKNKKGGAKTKQSVEEAKKAAANIKNEMRGHGETARKNDADAQFKHEQDQKKKKRKKAFWKTVFAPVTVPAKAGAILGVVGGALPVLALLLPVAAVVIIFTIFANFFASSDTDEASIKDRLFNNENMNYAQYVVDKTADVLGNGFEGACEASAFTYYADSRIISQTKSLTADSSGHKRDLSLKIPWYCGINRGAIDNIWMQEEADNVTLDDNGELMFRNLPYLEESSDTIGDFTYKQDKNARKNLSGSSANLLPIVSMAHYRYDGEWDFDNYEKVLAYCYTMYVRSHDIARFDSNVIKYGKDEKNRWREAFHKEIVESHWLDEIYEPNTLKFKGMGGKPEDTGESQGYTSNSDKKKGTHENTNEGKDLYSLHQRDVFLLGKFRYDVDTEILTRPSFEDYKCDNIFIHGMNMEGEDTLKRLVECGMEAFNRFKKKLLNGPLSSFLNKKFNNDLFTETTDQLGVARLEPFVYGIDGQARVSVKDLDKNDDLSDKNNLYPLVPDVDHPNSGHYYYCENVWYVQAGNDTVDNPGNGDDTICQVKEHEHTPDCYVVDESVTHVHSESCYGWVEKPAPSPEETGEESEEAEGEESGEETGGEETTPSPEYEYVLTCGHEDDGVWDYEISNYALTQEMIDETIPEYDENDGRIGYNNGPAESITNDKVTWKLKEDDDPYHKHKDWESAEEPGCWITAAVCLGHCGGHIDPFVDVVETYTFQGLANFDPGIEKEASFMGASDFSESGIALFSLADDIADSLEAKNALRNSEKEGKTVFKGWFDIERYGMVSVEKYGEDSSKKEVWKKIKEAILDKQIKLDKRWKEDWESRIAKWYSPGPNNPASMVDFVGKTLVSKSFDIGHAMNQIWHGNFGGAGLTIKNGAIDVIDDVGALGTIKSLSGAIGLESKWAADFWETYETFPGWFTYSEEAGELRLDEGIMGDLISLYGEPKDDYGEGREYWEEFEVQFPHAGMGTLSTKQIEDILDAIDEAYPGLFDEDPARRDVCEEALRGVGCFYYKCDYNGHMNGCTHASGPSECTGFVSGVLSRALDYGEESDTEECPRGNCGLYNPATGYFDGNYAGVHCTRAAAGEGFTLYSGYGADDVDDYDGTQCARGNWNAGYVRPCGETVSDVAATALPGDVVSSSCIDPDNGHVMIFMGTFADPINGTGVPQNMVVDCHGGKNGGSYYWANDKYKLYPSIYRPPVYTIQLDNNDDWK